MLPLHSPLGQHEDPNRGLKFAKGAQYIAYRTGHMALLSSPQVLRQMVDSLTPGN